MEDINAFLRSKPNWPTSHVSDVTSLFETFAHRNEDPRTSANFASELADDVGPLIAVLREPRVEEEDRLALAVLLVLKVLSRKYQNRVAVGADGVRGVVRTLSRAVHARIAAESCNVLLNLCYERENVELVLNSGGVAPLVASLRADDAELQANAAGALQSITYQERGRAAVREGGAVTPLVLLLSSETQKVRTRAVGALHNLSSDADSIRLIRRQDAVPLLVAMLDAPQTAICSSAAGALQNMSREKASCDLIRSLDGVPPLTGLLFGPDVQSQVCAAGALLNILGHPAEGAVDTSPEYTPERAQLRKLMESAVVLGMAYHGIFTDP